MLMEVTDGRLYGLGSSRRFFSLFFHIYSFTRHLFIIIYVILLLLI